MHLSSSHSSCLTRGEGLLLLVLVLVVVVLLLFALLLSAKITHELLEESGLEVEVFVLLVHDNLALDRRVVFVADVELQDHLLVKTSIRVAQDVELQPVLPWSGKLEAHLLLDEALGAPHPLEGDDAAEGALHQEDPPLLIFGLREEGCVNWANRLAILQVVPLHLHGDGGDVADNYLSLVLDLDGGPQLHVTNVLAESLDIQHLLGLQGRHALPVLRLLLQEGVQGRDRVFPRFAVLDVLLGEVGDLQ
mmetsp:Transcript_160302/g.510180  ORF Transcript_160302/g.510180 Transcript_160302/m.510180 type:complete len:249 (-) Transcript_160302:1295-2041(-)